MSEPSGCGTPHVAYISQQFPSLTMTFVYREVLALRALGVRIRPIAIWPPALESLSAEARPLVEETYYLMPLRWNQLIRQHLRYILTRPRRYFGALLTLVVLNQESLRNRLRSFGHFLYGVLAAAEVERCGARHLHADFALNAATVALVAARLTARPFSFAAHANDIFVNPVLLREKMAAAAFVVPVSEFNRQCLARLGAASKLHVVHCGLDLRQYSPRRDGSAPTRPLILSVGRLVEKKGFHVLIAACHCLARSGLDFECHIIGGGPEEARLRALILEYGLQERLTLLGPLPQEQVRERLRLATVFALPCIVARDQDRDGIPVALMEAMALTVPVVSTPISGIPELVKDGVNGRLVPPGDAQALADVLADLLSHRNAAEKLGRAGRLTIEREFNIEQSARQLRDLLTRELAELSVGPEA
jgi:glycosyltransferase involved in cell wall biosynthesis